jgi:hypothetical protein
VHIGGITLTAFPSTHTLIANETVHLIAVPNAGYRFVNWSGSSSETTESISVTMTCDINLTAVFVPTKHRLITAVSPGNGGEIILQPPQPVDGYLEGTSVTTRAKPASGYAFKEWSGDTSGTKSAMNITLDSAKSVTAMFVERTAFNIVRIAGGVGLLLAGVAVFVFAIRKR